MPINSKTVYSKGIKAASNAKGRKAAAVRSAIRYAQTIANDLHLAVSTQSLWRIKKRYQDTKLAAWFNPDTGSGEELKHATEFAQSFSIYVKFEGGTDIAVILSVKDSQDKEHFSGTIWVSANPLKVKDVS